MVDLRRHYLRTECRRLDKRQRVSFDSPHLDVGQHRQQRQRMDRTRLPLWLLHQRLGLSRRVRRLLVLLYR